MLGYDKDWPPLRHATVTCNLPSSICPQSDIEILTENFYRRQEWPASRGQIESVLGSRSALKLYDPDTHHPE